MVHCAGRFVLPSALLLGLAMLSGQAPASDGPRGTFAADSPAPVPYDAKRARGYLEAVCKIGPRISGSDGMKKQQELLEKHFSKLGGKVEWQKFTARQRSQRGPVAMANLIVRWHPERQRRIILCSHYDTRAIADQEPDAREWREPFVRRDDGGSGAEVVRDLTHQ